MNNFVPSDRFVERTMEAVLAYEARKARRSVISIKGLAAAFLQTGAVLAGCGIAIINFIRLYYTVFAPVLSR